MTHRNGERTQADQIRAYLRKHPDANRAAFIEATELEVSHSSFSGVKTKMEAEGELKKARNGHKKQSRSQKRILELEKRVRYLEWVRIGEREGFVDLLLKESANG